MGLAKRKVCTKSGSIAPTNNKRGVPLQKKIEKMKTDKLQRVKHELKVKVLAYGKEHLIDEQKVRTYARFVYRNRTYELEVMRNIGDLPTKLIEVQIFNALEKVTSNMQKGELSQWR